MPESSDLKSVNESIDMRDGYKRVFDLAVIIITYILLFPLWLIVWIFVPLAIWLEDRGPVFYAQERIGLAGKTFQGPQVSYDDPGRRESDRAGLGGGR